MRSIKEADVRDKCVLVRVDFNVPLKNGKVVDDSRIRAALPTINFLRKHGARVVLCSHLGRPDGKIVEDLRLKPVAERLSKLIKYPVHYVLDCIGEEVEDVTRGLHDEDVVLLENLRFYPEEELNDSNFARSLSSCADIYVNDAFGVSHRAHASVDAITKFLPSYAGFLLEKEVNALSSLLKAPARPFVAVLGGAKVSDKIGVIKNLLTKVDSIIIGGAMMCTFFKALNLEVGKSKCEPDKVDLARELLKSKKIMLPVDVIVAKSPKDKGKVVSSKEIPKDMMALDIGPFSVELFKNVIKNSKTVFWNGPLGMCEIPSFAKGTKSLAKVISKVKTSIIGGGDTVAIVGKLKFSHVSTGGGASLEFLEGKSLPGIVALDKNNLN